MKKIVSLENFIYLSIFAMPAYLIKVVIFGLPTNMFEIIAIIAIIWFVIERKSYKIAWSDYKKYLIPIIMIIGGLTLSTLFNGLYAMGLGIIKGWFVVPIALAFVTAEVLKKEKSGTILVAIYNSALTVASIALVYFFLGKTTFDGRLEAFLNSPNFLAMFLAPAIIIGCILFKERKKKHIFSLVVIVSAFYLTFSYAAWLAVFIALAGIFFWQGESQTKWKKIALLSLVILIAVLSQAGTNKLEKIFQLKGRSAAASRLMIWESAAKIISDNAVWGIGPGNFQNKYLEYQKHFPAYLEWAVPQPHNLLLAFWLQAGLMGLGGFLILIFRWFRELFSLDKKKITAELFIANAIIIYILVHGIFDTTYFKNDLAVLFWLSIFIGIKKHSASSAENIKIG